MGLMSSNRASEPTLGSRGKTTLAVGSGAVPAVDMRQQPMESARESGSAPCTITVISDVISREKTEPVPRFLVIARADESTSNFDKISPFVISKQLFGLVGNLKSIKKIKEGLLVETVSELQALKLLKTQRLGTYNVQVSAHRTLNYSKGVVTCRDFLNCTIEEILEELRSEGVMEVRRIRRKSEGIFVDTSSHILTFNRPKLPVKIKAAFYSLPVRPYVPNPIRCFNCQQFGHTAQFCENQTCCTCGYPPHEEECKQPFKCVNCGGEHHSRANNCPSLKEEINIQHIKTLEKISYTEAKRKIQSTKPTGTTFANIVNSKEKTMKDPMQEFIPNISKMLEEQIRRIVSEAFTNLKIPSLPPSQNPRKEIRSSQVNSIESGGEDIAGISDISQSEKRKRVERFNYREETDSEESLSSHSYSKHNTKKKKGVPKGKFKKPPDVSKEKMSDLVVKL